ncbi:hypothetical protein [Natronosalvus amylolyticus]|uniref:hypothetical protein n=1 Tax=Natronosalvus amylolyticus TaxID=2961994 RepID=UPI0020C9C2F0|nr:hypothetical protein [Natronosalvus amylolyticus]
MDIEALLIWLREWGPLLSAIGSFTLTGALVYLYYQQHSLLRYDLNREHRRQHSETLRKRIREWHGNIDPIIDEDATFLPEEDNLPRVGTTSVESAKEQAYVFGEDSTFRVVPYSLENDRYLEDLLENHAPELRELKADLESLHADFLDCRETFCDTFEPGPSHEAEAYVLEPTEKYSRWVFDSALRLHREDSTSSKDRLKDIATDAVENQRIGANQEKQFYSADSRGDTSYYTYEATIKSGDYEDFAEFDDELEERVLDFYIEAIDDIGDTGGYEPTVEAANILDEMEIKVKQLRTELVEYEGRPLYMGSCEHLERMSV